MTESDKRDDDGDANGDQNHENASESKRRNSREDRQSPGVDEAPEDSKSGAARPATEQRRDASHRRRRSGFLVWLTLLIALASLALASRPFWSPWLYPGSAEKSGPTIAEFENLEQRVTRIRQDSRDRTEALRTELDRLASELASDTGGPSAAELDGLADRIEQLSVRVERLQGEGNTAMAGVRSRLEDLESEVGRRLEQFELRLSSVGSDLGQAEYDLATRLLLMEVDSLFAIARNQLAIGGNSRAATSAWRRAMERLTALEDARFQDLKNAARREFDRLQAFNPPELASQVEALYRIADEVSGWPVKTVQPGSQADASGENTGWRDRLGRVVGNLVRVESVDREFIGPGAADLARDRVRSALQTAALAIVRTRPELARRLIDEAAEAARGVFDAEAPNVAEALGRLEQIARNTGLADAPALTESRAEISRLLGEMR